MERLEFESVLAMGKSMQKLTADSQDYDRSEFWRGFQRGIRRLFYGKNFGTDEEHVKWMNFHDGEYRKKLQDGYRAGVNYHG
jgi:hypothetical protein